MATTEVAGLMKYKDAAGNLFLLLPVTTKDNVEGLENVDNTSDADKPISTAMQAALDQKAASDHGHERGPVAIATAGDGAAYTATVEGITALTAGDSFIMVPHVACTSTMPSLNVNGLGAKYIRCRLSNSTATTVAGNAAGWLAKGKPVRVTFDGTYWIADVHRPNMADAYGVLDFSHGGFGGTSAEEALENIGAAPAFHSHPYVQVKRVPGAMPSATFWKHIAYGNGIFVAVAGGSATAAYSEDGAAWTTITMPGTFNWCGVAYGNGMFVAISSTAAAAYSEDGITWTQMLLPTNSSWTGIAFGNGKFVVVGDNAVLYSQNGTSWNAGTLNGSVVLNAVTYGNNKFVAVPNGSASAYYSADGITWTAATLPGASTYTSIAYGNGIYVALAANVNGYAYSYDGITWTYGQLFATAHYTAVAFGNGKFVGLANANNCCLLSEDGINWTTPAMTDAAHNWVSVAYGNGMFVAIADSDTVVVNSRDGNAWKTEYAELLQDGVVVTNDVKAALGL